MEKSHFQWTNSWGAGQFDIGLKQMSSKLGAGNRSNFAAELSMQGGPMAFIDASEKSKHPKFYEQPLLTSYDSHREHSVEHLLEVQRLVADAHHELIWPVDTPQRPGMAGLEVA